MKGIAHLEVRTQEIRLYKDEASRDRLEFVFVLVDPRNGDNLGFIPFNQGWSRETVQKLRELRESAEKDIAARLFDATDAALDERAEAHPVDLRSTWGDTQEETDGIAPG